MEKMEFSHQLKELETVLSLSIRMIRSIVINVLECTDKVTLNLAFLCLHL